VEVLRLALARERVRHAGQTLTLPLLDGSGRPPKLMIASLQERIPILLAAIGPRNTALTGGIADDRLPTYFSSEHVRVGELRGLLVQRDGSQDAARIEQLRAVAELAG
jgi:alkanesulfonate monooxygenase SsuD/methylene tetrahydromethanopterin reductase-like flavin-dependent oxidoreductase (luciferase family)